MQRPEQQLHNDMWGSGAISSIVIWYEEHRALSPYTLFTVPRILLGASLCGRAIDAVLRAQQSCQACFSASGKGIWNEAEVAR